MPYIGNTTSDFSIDTGNITNRAVTALKLSPSSVGSNGQVLSVDGSGNLQWSTDAALTLIDEDNMSSNSASSVPSQQSVKAYADTKAVLTGSTNNTITTVTGANALQGEANLTFDGSTLGVTGDVTMTNTSSNPQLALISAANGISEIQFGDTNDAVRANLIYRSGTAGDALCFNGYNNTERLRINSSGRVAIGNSTNNANPTALLGVIADDGEAANLYIGKFHNLEATTGESFGVNIQAGSSADDHGLRVKNRANDSTQLIVRGDGNVGIGTASPGSKLHVTNDNSFAAKFGGTGGGSNYFIEVGQLGTNGSAGFNATGTSGSMLFKVSGSEYMRIAHTTGNVGIGTSSPSEKLDVEGTIECLNELRSKTGNDLKLNAGSANRDVFLQVNDSTLMTVQGSTGNVGIGTTSPGHKLAILGGASSQLEVKGTEADFWLTSTGSGSNKTWRILGSTGGSTHRFRIYDSANGREPFYIDNDGVSHFGGDVKVLSGDIQMGSGRGINFSPTSDAGGMTSETFDDYEEGTWTAGAQDFDGSVTTNSSKYIKVGNVVHVQAYISISNVTDSSDVRITGLPFTAGGGSAVYSQMATQTSADVTDPILRTQGGTAILRGCKYSGGDGDAKISYTDVKGKWFIFGGTYWAD